MHRDDAFRRVEDQPTRPVAVPRLRSRILNDSIRVDLNEPPRREPAAKRISRRPR